MMHGHEKSDLVIVAMKPANKAKKAPCGGVCGGGRSGVGGAKGGGQPYWTQSQGRVSKALERIRRLVPLPTRGRSRMRESRTYGSGRGACDETHVPTATASRVHHAARRRGGRVAARGARAASGREARTAQLQVLRPDTQLRGRGVHYMRVVQPRAGQLIWSRPDPAATDECIAPRHSLRGARSMTFQGSAR